MAKMSRRQLRQMIMENMNESMVDKIRQGLGIDPSYSDKLVKNLPVNPNPIQRGEGEGLFSNKVADYLVSAFGETSRSGFGIDRLGLLERKVKEALPDLIDEVLEEMDKKV